MKWHHWTILALGIWLIASPWILGFAEVNLAMWNAIGVGALTAILILWNMTPPDEE